MKYTINWSEHEHAVDEGLKLLLHTNGYGYFGSHCKRDHSLMIMEKKLRHRICIYESFLSVKPINLLCCI